MKATPSTPTAFASEPVEPEESFADIFSEFQRTHSRREPGGSQIRGTVVSVTADSVLVDIGYKSEGILPLTAFAANKEQPKVGDALQVSVKGGTKTDTTSSAFSARRCPGTGRVLSVRSNRNRPLSERFQRWSKAACTSMLGCEPFCLRPEAERADAAELEKLVGEEIRVRITKLDVADEDVVVDRRVVTEEEALESKARRYAEVEERRDRRWHCAQPHRLRRICRPRRGGRLVAYQRHCVEPRGERRGCAHGWAAARSQSAQDRS